MAKIIVTDTDRIEIATSQYINHLLEQGRIVMVQDGGSVSVEGKLTALGKILGNASTLDEGGRTINTYHLVPDAG